MLTPLILDIVSVAYGVYAVVTLVNVVKKRASLFDSRITSDDARLASAFAFCFLWPPAVLMHEGGHALVASVFGATNIRLHFYFYWGEISYLGLSSFRQIWWIALAGNVVTYALGWLGIVAARWPQRHPIWRVILFSFGRNQLFVVLLWYPAICLFRVFYGDFSVIYGYGTAFWWAGAAVVAAVNVASLAAYAWATYTDAGKAWAANYLWGPGRRRSAQPQAAATSPEIPPLGKDMGQ